MTKSNITYRIPPAFWQSPSRFRALLEELKKQRSGFDDVALFCGFTHSIRQLDTVRREQPRLRAALADLRQYGIPGGINLLCTIGHHPENLPDIPGDMQALTGLDGRICPGSVCPRDQRFRNDYLRGLLAILCECSPDFLWLDDDIRFCGHGELKLVCFCERCMAEFNQLHHAAFSRETLAAAFDSSDPQESIFWRRRWLDFSGAALAGLFACIEQIVHAINPNIELGAMDAGMRVGDSAGLDILVNALSGPKTKPVRWRPGGGAYTDRAFDDFLIKAHCIGCEAAWLPDSVHNIQAEVENFNYQRLVKSVHATCFEGAVYMAAGLTGCAWNVLDAEDPLATYQPLLKELTSLRTFLDLQAKWARIRPSGIYHGWVPELPSGAFPTPGTSWEDTLWQWPNPHFSGLFTAGFPPAYRPEDATVTILTSQSARILSEPVLLNLFQRGVYCLADALPVLEARGLGDLTGFRIAERIEDDAIEEFLEHPFHRNTAGFRRDCRQSFPWGHESAYSLVPTVDGTETLARLVNYQGKELAACSLGISRNRLGGRVAAAGYYPLRDLQFASKLSGMKQLFRWLAGSAGLAEIVTYHRIALWTRYKKDEGETAVQLVNASQDPAREAVLHLPNGSVHAEWQNWRGERRNLTGVQKADGSISFSLPELPPWSVALLTTKKR